MNQEMIQFCLRKGVLVDKHVLKILEGIENFDIAKNILEKIILQYNQKIITKEFLIKNNLEIYKLLFNYFGDNIVSINSFLVNIGVNIENQLLEENIPEKKINY